MITYYGGQCQLNLDANCSHLVIPHPSGVSACVLNDRIINPLQLHRYNVSGGWAPETFRGFTIGSQLLGEDCSHGWQILETQV